MNFTRTDASALLAIVLGSAIGIATLGPQTWLVNGLTTTTTTTYSTYGATSTRSAVEAGTPDIDVETHVTESQVRLRVRRGDEAEVVVGGVDSSLPQPLIYVDGVRIEGELSDLDPDLIDRVEVVKGDAALERYGPGASLGVVEIFLKRSASPPSGS